MRDVGCGRQAQENRRPRKVRVGGYSHPIKRDMDFLRSTCAAVMPHLLEFQGGELVVTGYVPVGSEQVGEGHIALSFSGSTDVLACIGISFGVVKKDGSPFRSPFDEAKWKSHPEYHFSSSICVMNFDEAWLLACWIGEHLGVRDLRIRYGA